MQKLCIYCHKIVLEGFDDKERKYYEKGTKTLHTRERCQDAKEGKIITTQQGQQGNGQDITELTKKVDTLLEKVKELIKVNNQLMIQLAGQGTLDVE